MNSWLVLEVVIVLVLGFGAFEGEAKLYTRQNLFFGAPVLPPLFFPAHLPAPVICTNSVRIRPAQSKSATIRRLAIAGTSCRESESSSF
jgi:hypothetical protein